MTSFTRATALAGLLALSGTAFAGTLTISSDIDGSEPTFDQPLSTAATLTNYDSYSFTVNADGMYSFLSFYPGDTTLDENLDGALLLYENAFDPLAPGDFIAEEDDYTAGTLPSLAGLDGACVGSNCSGFDAALTAGTTYILVQTSFTDVPNSFGQPSGAYDLTITGPGDPTIVPLPAAAWLLISALMGFSALRRRS